MNSHQPPECRWVGDRFWSKVARGRPDDCWAWQAGVIGKAPAGYPGYGSFRLDGKMRLAHRLAWAIGNQSDYPPTSVAILHTCDNPLCCNPAHLRAGTQKDNMRDMYAKGRGARQKRTHCPKGHPYDAENTLYRETGARQCRTCAGRRSASGVGKGNAQISPALRDAIIADVRLGTMGGRKLSAKHGVSLSTIHRYQKAMRP